MAPDAPPSALSPLSGPAGLYGGLGIVAAGLLLIGWGWGRVAGTDRTSDQLPYLVIGGAGGLALVLIGLALLIAAVVTREAIERRRQTYQLALALQELAAAVEENPEPT
jgi:hypothetical protein